MVQPVVLEGLDKIVEMKPGHGEGLGSEGVFITKRADT